MLEQSINLAVLISGNGSNLQSIIDHIEQGKLQATISQVISNKPQAYGLQRAAQHQIPAHCVNSSQFNNRLEFESELLTQLRETPVDLIILAGFMRILSESFISHYQNRILNIHPSLLPKYKGLNTHRRVLEAGDSQHGATVHVVTDQLDSGPIILQGFVDVAANDTEVSLQNKVHKVEHVIYPQAIHNYAQTKFNPSLFSKH